MNEILKIKLAQLPDSPGCYMMRSHGEIIYVGKAVNLKNRVRQYFQNSRNHTPKVQAMVAKVDDFDIMLVDGEFEALVLENNLIKLHKPWYNILLKDDKTYPYIRINLAEDFPRVELVRRIERDGGKYFGPYIGANVVREVLEVLRAEFPLRTCVHMPTNTEKRACVHAQIGHCLAPCKGGCTREQYHEMIARVTQFLTGQAAPVLAQLKERMAAASASMQFEKAAMYRDRINAVEQVLEKQKAMQTRGEDYDVIATASDGVDALIQVMLVRGGKLLGSETRVMPRSSDEPPEELIQSFIMQYYDEDNLPPPLMLLQELPPELELVSNWLREKRGAALEIRLPQRGEKRGMMEMAQKNARDAADKRAATLRRSYERTTGALVELQEALSLPNLPHRIEGYDISNTQGVLSVGSMVVMQDGLPDNKAYRYFNIKTVKGPNDFASMHEVLTRRFSHGLQELEERRQAGLDPEGGKFSHMPDLVLIDGGPVQLKMALEAAAEVGVSVPMFGLAKRIEEIYLPDQEETILLDRHSPALHLIQRLRDEAHRFAIDHHRKRRAKSSVASQLDTIAGVGPARKKALLTHFKTVDALKSADLQQLADTPGMNRPSAEAVYAFFHGAAETESK